MIPECITCANILHCNMQGVAKDGKCINYKPRKEDKEKNKDN